MDGGTNERCGKSPIKGCNVIEEWAELGTNQRALFTIEADKMAEEFTQRHGPLIRIIDSSYVQLGEHANMASNYIREGEYVRGLIFAPINPCKLFVILTQFWNELEAFQREIQHRMTHILSTFTPAKDASVDNKLTRLMPGLFVMVYCCCGKTEWFRAVVQRVDRRSIPFAIHVQLTDFGCSKIIRDLNHIKYMRRDIFRDFLHQMVECKLHFHAEVCRDDYYPEFSSDMDFSTFVLNKPMGVYFKKRIHFRNLLKNEWRNECVWIVTMNLLCDADTRGDHTRQQSLTDINNPYLESEIGDELERRSGKKKRIWAGPNPMSMRESQDTFHYQMSTIHEHGEFLCGVKTYNISDVVAKYIITDPSTGDKSGNRKVASKDVSNVLEISDVEKSGNRKVASKDVSNVLEISDVDLSSEFAAGEWNV